MRRILTIFGTRPEAIKMAPVIKEIQKYPSVFTNLVCVTAQHREMLDQVLSVFEITPDFDLDIMKREQDLFEITCLILSGLKKVIQETKPDLILVQGDTTTTMAASLASFYSRTRIGHVEAGLRTGNKLAPYPEEMNRRVTGAIADFHFAPTALSRKNLIEENIDPKAIYVTGNTVIDALLLAVSMIEGSVELKDRFASDFSYLNPEKKLLLVTGHRRENFGRGFENICRALAKVAGAHPEVQIVFPVHLNPNVQKPVHTILGEAGIENVFLIDPLEYLPFVYLMNRAHCIITDSGGIQEEAPSLGKPVLVMREATERPEGVEAGSIKLIGTEPAGICSSISRLLEDPAVYQEMSTARNPYGDGKASDRIVRVLREVL